MPTTETTRGVITLVQERRFQLVDASGGRHLFLLAENAGLDEVELKRCADARTAVRVHWRELPHLVARLAVGMEAEIEEKRVETRTS